MTEYTRCEKCGIRINKNYLENHKKQNHVKEYTCVICNKKCSDFGNNPSPVKDSGLCCDSCNLEVVIPMRLRRMK